MAPSFRFSNRILSFVTAVSLYSCASTAQPDAAYRLTDPQVTSETLALYANLIRLQNQNKVLFGHQDDLAYGVEWKYEKGRSDVKDVTGEYPAVYGWDLGGLERDSDKNLDGIPFNKMRDFIREGHKRGGVITLSWHINNPLNDKDAWNTDPGSLASALPGGSQHEKYKSWLGKGAAFIKTLTDKSGRPIPILYRPYHELTGNWFWWCQNNASAGEFKKLWDFTVDFYRSQGIHNLIYVYNTSDFKTPEEFLAYYPGSDRCDMLSFDIYQMKDVKAGDPFIENMQRQLKDMAEIGKREGKPVSIGETGFEAIPDAKWWTQTLLKAIGDHQISYVLMWRNHGYNEYLKPPRMHYYAPYKGQVSADDFLDFFRNDRIYFEKKAAKANLYAPVK